MPKTRKSSRLNTAVFITACFVIVVGLILLPYLINYYFSPDELIKNTTRAIETLTGTKITIRNARLSLLEGITFEDVRVLVPQEKLNLEPDFTCDDAMLLSAKSFQITLKRKGIFGLNLQLGAIIVNNPMFHFVKDAAKNRWNWQMLFAGPLGKPGPRHFLGICPPIGLHDGRIVFTELKDRQRRPLGRINFATEAQPQNNGQFYRITLKTWTDESQGPVAVADFNPRTGEILGGVIDTIDLKNIEKTLPDPYRSWCGKLHLSGSITVPEMVYRPGEKSRVVVVLDNVRAKVPLSMAELNNPSEKALLNLFDLSGKIVLRDHRLIIPKLDGKLNGSPCRINGEIPNCTAPIEQADFHLRVAATQFQCPNYLDPAQRDYIEKFIPWKLRCFFHDFKPIGKLDLDLLISRMGQMEKTTTKGSALTLTGKVQPRLLSAEYHKFPYRIDNLVGTLQLSDGGFVLQGITGTTGQGKVTVNGTISEPSKYAKIDLFISSAQTPIDPKLFNALAPKYRRIFDKFNPSGFADTEIELHQPYGENQPWRTQIEAALYGVTATYEQFPYAVSDIHGDLILQNDLLELRDVSARHGKTAITINAKVEGIDKPSPAGSLTISAKNATLDEDLIKILPVHTGQFIRDCRIDALIDLGGNVNFQPDKPIDYAFQCQMKNAKLCYRDFPYPVENLSGRLTIKPRQLIIESATARKGTQSITAGGEIFFLDRQRKLNLNINADNFAVDSLLYDALDPSQKTIWNRLNPSGKIKVRAKVSRNAAEPWNWNLGIDLLDAAIKYKSLPKITGLRGQIVFGPSQASFNNINGLVDQKHPLAMQGTVQTTPKTTTIRLSRLQFTQIDVNRDIFDIIGNDGVFKNLKWTPGGSLTADLNRVEIELAPENRRRWTLDGKLQFKNAGIGAFDSIPTDLDYTGRLLWVEPASRFALAGRLNLKSFNWNERRVSALTANLTKTLDNPSMTIDPIHGFYANGQLTGMAKLKFDRNQTSYGMQLTFDSVDAATALYLNSSKGNIHGKMRGEIYMTGIVGKKYSGIGGGILQITDAEALKVPLMAQIHRNISSEPADLAEFHDITAQFTLEKYRVELPQIELTGPTLSLTGSGNLNLSNDRISLHLMTASPQQLKKLPILPELMQGAAGEFTEIEIRGTTANPLITARPLKNISETLQTFIEGKAVK